MPRKKQINIEPQALQPIEEPMEESIEQEAPPRKSTERIMPQMSLKPENPRKTHVAGFMMLFLATAAAGAALYYWPGYGLRDFMVSNSSTTSTYTPVNHKPSDAGTNTTPSATTSTTSKTYASSTYNFEVTYPSNATLTGDFDKDKSLAIHEGTAAQADLQLEFVAKPITDVRGEIASTFKVVSARDTKFAGVDAREIIVGVEDIGPARILLISRPGGTFKIINPVGSYDQILASFKFTK
jgi:hypothetical protein